MFVAAAAVEDRFFVTPSLLRRSTTVLQPLMCQDTVPGRAMGSILSPSKFAANELGLPSVPSGFRQV